MCSYNMSAMGLKLVPVAMRESWNKPLEGFGDMNRL